MKYLPILAAAFLVGCGESPENQHKITQINFNNPEYVGTLQDGRKISRVYVQTQHHVHSVYFFSNVEETNSITVNYRVPAGKTTRNEVIVLLNGEPVVTNYTK